MLDKKYRLEQVQDPSNIDPGNLMFSWSTFWCGKTEGLFEFKMYRFFNTETNQTIGYIYVREVLSEEGMEQLYENNYYYPTENSVIVEFFEIYEEFKRQGLGSEMFWEFKKLYKRRRIVLISTSNAFGFWSALEFNKENDCLYGEMYYDNY